MSAVAPPVRKRDQAYPWTVVGITLALSMTGNALHAHMAHGPTVTALTAALWALVFPGLGALVLHTILRVWRRHRGGGARWIVAVPAAAVFAMAFALSFQGLHALTLAIGVPPASAWMGPLVIDVTTVAGVLDAMLLHHKPAARTVAQIPAADAPARTSAPAAQPAYVDLPEHARDTQPTHAPTPAPQPSHLDAPEPAADDAHTAPIPRTPAPVRTLDDAATQRAQVCARIAAMLATPGETPSSRRLAAEYPGLGESTVRGWINRLTAGTWTVTPDGRLITDPPRERTG